MKVDISGLLLLNKPRGISSNAALQKVKRLFNAKKAGHTGTLDPLATGLLPICFGEATKFSSFLIDGNKEYIATIKLGSATTTYDAEGEITDTAPVNVSYDNILDVINAFIGKQIQTPPIYSALKVNGIELYKYARNGIDVEIKSRNVEIFEIEPIEFTNDHQLTLRVLCSKGTYIRSLAHDIGNKLGTYAHLIMLKRTQSNEFILNEKLTLDYLSGLTDGERYSQLLSVDKLVKHLPKLDINESQYHKIKFGNPFEHNSNYLLLQQLRVYYNKQFLGIVKVVNSDQLQPVRLISQKL